jgi:hypothetical protein
MPYASAKKAWGISDRSGFRYRLKNMRKEWTGALVGPDEYEPKQPQLYPPKTYPDPQALRNPRPEQVETKSKILLILNPFFTSLVDYNVLTVYEAGHGRTTGDRVRFSNAQSFQDFNQATLNRNQGYQITVTTTDEYTITVNAPIYQDANTSQTDDMAKKSVGIGITSASIGLTPHVALLESTQVIAGRSLGDVTGDNNGFVTVRDALDYLNWQAGTNSDAAEVQYIEQTMNPYMYNNFSQYKIYLQKSTIANSRGGGGLVTVETLENDAGSLYVSGVVGATRIGTISVVVGSTVTYTVTVQSVLGTNRYFIDGAQQATLNLSEGNTYIFDWSAATTHPVRFSTVPDGTHNGGVKYETGVVENDAGYTTTITVPVGAPTLYYYCQNHPNMGGQINTP